MNKCLTLFLIGFLSAFTTGAQKQDSLLSYEEILWLEENKDKIRYAPNIFWPPADFIDKAGVHQGIVADYIKLIEKRLGIKFQKVYYNNWPEIVRALQTSEVDFVGGIHQTTARDEFLKFTDFYLTIPLVILTSKEYAPEISETHINTMKLACAADYASSEYIRKNYPEAEIIECQNDLEAILKTSLGNTDGTVIDMMTASFLVDKYGINNLQFVKELKFEWHLRIGIRKDLTELYSILNKALASVSEQEREAIYKKWVNITKPSSPGFIEKHLNTILYISLLLLALFFLVSGFGIYLKRQVRKRTEELSNELKARKQAEISLAVSERKFREIFNSTGEAIFIQAPETGSILDCNEQAVKMYGFDDKNDLLKADVSMLSAMTDGFDEKAIKKNTKQAFEKGEYSFDWPARRKNGEHFWAAVYLKRALITDNNYLIAVVRNINDRKTHEQELYEAKKKAEESDRLKTAFLNNLSHEIRTPLNAVCGFSNLLNNRDLSKKERKQYVKIIQNSSNQLLAIVTNILTISSLETKQEKIKITTVNISSLIKDLHEIFSLQNSNRQIRIRSTNPEKDLKIRTDETKPEQILSNLISNALKFTEEGIVEFGYRLLPPETPKTVEFFVRDTGIGIQPNMQKKIFDRFRQGKLLSNKVYEGTGLGLSISKGFVELLGGKIWLESQPGKGSVFYFTIPYEPAE